MKKGFFITGTGTGVGKTHVTAALARLGCSLGKRVFAFKPIETGCMWIDGALTGADQSILCEAAGGWQTGVLRGAYQFEPAVAPAVASPTIDLERVQQALLEGIEQADLILVEGAGGWRVPITATQDMGSLARVCGFPVIVVGSAGLGTINHSLLTIESIERDQLEIAAVVLSQLPTDSAEMAQSNARQIQLRWRGLVLVYESDSRVLQRFT